MKSKLLSMLVILSIIFSCFGQTLVSANGGSNNNTNQTSVITTLSDKELEGFTLRKNLGVKNKNWTQRLQWFESKIVDKYKKMNAKNILVVGEQKFLDTFKEAVSKSDWKAKFTYAVSPNQAHLNAKDVDLVIDAKYQDKYFKKIYGNLKILSFVNVYDEILINETKNFLDKNKIKYYYFSIPDAKKIKNLDEFDKKYLGKGLRAALADKKFIDEWYGDNEECKQYVSKYLCKRSGFNNGKFTVLKDYVSPLLKILAGKRYTVGVPKIFKNSLYVFGPCIAEGSYASDTYTIESFLQRDINKEFVNKYRVVNCGKAGETLMDSCDKILWTDFKPGDIVVIIQRTIPKFNCIETSQLFDRPHNYGHWMLDIGAHMNHIGHSVMANFIYETIKPQLSNDEPTGPAKTIKYKFDNPVDTFVEDNPDLKKYLGSLAEIKKKTDAKGKIGSIVMNCNPFTLGHKYLIEQAAKQVDHLYIFVVEEDKSVFPFKDRLELVKQGTQDLRSKVTVLPSGHWIISLKTFPEYFVKGDKQSDVIDASKDVRIFGEYVCPALGINKRFVGEEPFDNVTKQYNDAMREALPYCNVEFQEIPRKAVSVSDVISATKVRKAIEKNDWEMVKKYVPKTTFDYIIKNKDRIVKAISEHKKTDKPSSNKAAAVKKAIANPQKTVDDGIYTISSKLDPNMCLDINQCSKNDKANLQLWQKNGTNAQKFKIQYHPDGYYTIKAMCSGKFIDVSASGKQNGTNIWQYSGNSSDAQKWFIVPDGAGYYCLVSKCNNMCMDVYGAKAINGANIHCWLIHAEDNQRFKLEKFKDKPSANKPNRARKPRPNKPVKIKKNADKSSSSKPSDSKKSA